ncbi:ABC transporter substrate-binding protein [Candidatus Bipolaricaulota bacterium]|nr:ABC transporter substrate-binding protein [Candidatus Bipolaricaulota bacterium]
MKNAGRRCQGKKLTRRNFFRLAGGSALSLTLPFVGRLASSSSRTLRIGGIFSLTGPNSPVGRTIRDGARIAIERINTDGGIAGAAALELIMMDGKTSQSGASDAARRLANRGDVSFVLGPLIGTHGAASQPILAAAGIPQIFFGTAVGFTERHDRYPLSIRFGTSTALQTAPILKYAHDVRDDRKLFLLAPNNQQGRDFRRVLAKQMGKLSRAELVGAEFYPPFNRDFSSLFTRAVNSGADGLVVGTGIPPDLVSIAREFHRQGVSTRDFSYYTGQTPNGSVGFYEGAVEQGIGSGIIYSWHYERGSYGREFERDHPPREAEDMESAFVEEFGAPPDSPPSASWGWGSVRILKQAIEGLANERSTSFVLSLLDSGRLPRETISYILPSGKSAESGPEFSTPFGNAGFLACGQFNVRLGVATFRGKKNLLLKDRGYGEDILGPLCP